MGSRREPQNMPSSGIVLSPPSTKVEVALQSTMDRSNVWEEEEALQVKTNKARGAATG